MEKPVLTEIDREYCTFILYTTSDERWLVDFFYSPSAYFDASLMLELTAEEKRMAQQDRNFLIAFASKIQYHYEDYFPRQVSTDSFQIK